MAESNHRARASTSSPCFLSPDDCDPPTYLVYFFRCHHIGRLVPRFRLRLNLTVILPCELAQPNPIIELNSLSVWTSLAEPVLQNSCQPAKQLEFHPFCSFWTGEYFIDHVTTWWEIMLEDRFACAFHVTQHSLPEMPT